LLIGNDAISFSARFGGAAQNLYVPMSSVRGVFARENGQGMFFEVLAESEPVESSEADIQKKDEVQTVNISNLPKKKPTLTIVK